MQNYNSSQQNTTVQEGKRNEKAFSVFEKTPQKLKAQKQGNIDRLLIKISLVRWRVMVRTSRVMVCVGIFLKVQ